MDSLEALIILRQIPGLGALRTRQLLAHFGNAAAVLEASESELRALPGFGPKLCGAILGWRALTGWQEDLRLVEQYRVDLVVDTDPRYPKGLRDLNDAPLYLYMLGSLKKSDERSIAIVGTRRASAYGRQQAQRFGRDLAAQGYTVVSGLARGIDTDAHRGALETGRTLAVIGSGLAQLYPPENRDLARQIVESGAIISEFPMRTAPDRQTFPQRNRLVAAMTEGCLLIEAPVKSGAMITMDRAQALGRDCYALPGRVDLETFAGNHTAIKRGEARLVDSPADISQMESSATAMPKDEVPLGPEEKQLLELMHAHEPSIDELKQRSGLPIAKINIVLMGLILKRKIKELPGKHYQKVS